MRVADPDLTGELLDCLKCVGQRDGPLVAAAEAYLVGSQLPDGGWCCQGEQDLFSRYHATLVAVSGLLDHTYTADGPCLPGAARVLPAWFDGPAGGAPPPADVGDAPLCQVDHDHSHQRERAADALVASQKLVLQAPPPRPPAHRRAPPHPPPATRPRRLRCSGRWRAPTRRWSRCCP